jgi:hypothetical protein
MTPSLDELHPAQNRAFRELYAAARHVVNHYRALAQVAGEDALLEAAAAVQRLLDELPRHLEPYDLHGFPAAQGLGLTAARAQTLPDHLLERNQALRVAVLDLQHVVTLLAYLAAVSETNGNDDLIEFCGRWESALRDSEERVRAAAAGQGRRPDQAVRPLYDTAVGRVGHKAQVWFGSFGEWFDRQARRRG